MPIAHYALVTSKNSNRNYPKILIHGLGSCIVLILFDQINNVSGISHILLPELSPEKKNTNIFPHKYADLSVKLLIKEMLDKGASKKNIYAVIIGGSTIFNTPILSIGEKNIQMVKKQLLDLKINVLKEEVGGSKGRSIIFNPNNYSILVKNSGEKSFNQIN